MKAKLATSGILICCLSIFSACENEQIIPAYDESSSVDKMSADPNSLKRESTARKKSDNPNPFTRAVSGTIEGRNFTGNFTVTEFVENADVLYGRGNLTDVKITGKDHKYLEYILESEAYLIPVTIDGMATASETFQIAAICNVLNLTFNGLNTNVLGLAVVIDPITITINANDDEVLGNLICTVLDTVNSVIDLVGLLNQILDLLSL